jgi:uncharacterized protein (DUF885 family)
MRKILLGIACVAFVVAAPAGPAHASDDDRFVALANGYIDKLLELDPEWATQLGEHRYDGRLTDRSREAIATRVAFNRETLSALRAIPRDQLGAANRIDHAILESNLERMIYLEEEIREWEWNPLYYNMGGAIYNLLVRDFAPLEARLRNVRARLREVPAVIVAARANLKQPPRVHTETAILQNQGNIALIRDELSRQAQPAAQFSEEMRPVQDAAVEALEAYGQWLETELLARSNGEFRLGDDKWRRKLRHTLHADLSKEQILERALADLAATQQAMYETALPLFREYFPSETDARKLKDVRHVCKAVLDRIAEERPTNETIVEKAHTTLVEATAFCRKKALVTVPDEPLDIIVMPEFQRGVAVAYCDSPGPLEPRGKTFYAISPTPADWDQARVTSFFKEYNDYMVYDLTVHEAVPGHYLQIAHSNRFQGPSMVRAVFHSGPFVEGWAVYSERLMAEAGFGGPKVRMQQLKMRLRVIVNAIIDQKIHTEGMTEKAAMALMMDEGFQEEGEAAGKWRRACLTSTQLSTYFVGSAEVEDIVATYRRKHGDKAPLRKLHDAVLSFGSPPPKYVREALGL